MSEVYIDEYIIYIFFNSTVAQTIQNNIKNK